MKEKISTFWNDHKKTIFTVAELTATAAMTAQAIVSVVKLANELRDDENDENDEELETEVQLSDEQIQAWNVILDN